MRTIFLALLSFLGPLFGLFAQQETDSSQVETKQLKGDVQLFSTGDGRHLKQAADEEMLQTHIYAGKRYVLAAEDLLSDFAVIEVTDLHSHQTYRHQTVILRHRDGFGKTLGLLGVDSTHGRLLVKVVEPGSEAFLPTAVYALDLTTFKTLKVVRFKSVFDVFLNAQGDLISLGGQEKSKANVAALVSTVNLEVATAPNYKKSKFSFEVETLLFRNKGQLPFKLEPPFLFPSSSILMLRDFKFIDLKKGEVGKFGREKGKPEESLSFGEDRQGHPHLYFSVKRDSVYAAIDWAIQQQQFDTIYTNLAPIANMLYMKSKSHLWICVDSTQTPQAIRSREHRIAMMRAWRKYADAREPNLRVETPEAKKLWNHMRYEATSAKKSQLWEQTWQNIRARRKFEAETYWRYDFPHWDLLLQRERDSLRMALEINTCLIFNEKGTVVGKGYKNYTYGDVHEGLILYRSATNKVNIAQLNGSTYLDLDAYEFYYNRAEAGFFDGLLVVKKDSLFGLIDKSGQLVLPLQYQALQKWHKGLWAFQKDGLWGFISREGREVIPPRFLKVDGWDEAYARAQVDKNTYVLVNAKGDIIAPQGIGFNLSSNDPRGFRDGLALVKYKGGSVYVNASFEPITPNAYAAYKPFREGKAIVRFLNSKTYSVIDKSGRVIASNFEEIDSYKGGVAVFKKSGEYFFLDHDGKEVTERPSFLANQFFHTYGYLELSYKRLYMKPSEAKENSLEVNRIVESQLPGDHYLVEIDHRWGVINKYGEEIVPIIFESVGRKNEGYFCACSAIYPTSFEAMSYVGPVVAFSTIAAYHLKLDSVNQLIANYAISGAKARETMGSKNYENNLHSLRAVVKEINQIQRALTSLLGFWSAQKELLLQVDGQVYHVKEEEQALREQLNQWRLELQRIGTLKVLNELALRQHEYDKKVGQAADLIADLKNRQNRNELKVISDYVNDSKFMCRDALRYLQGDDGLYFFSTNAAKRQDLIAQLDKDYRTASTHSLYFDYLLMKADYLVEIENFGYMRMSLEDCIRENQTYWRGNCSGRVMRALEQLQKMEKLFFELENEFEGSRSAIERLSNAQQVAQERRYLDQAKKEVEEAMKALDDLMK